MRRRNGVHAQLNNDVVIVIVIIFGAIVSDTMSFRDKLAKGTEKCSAPKYTIAPY